MSAASASTSTLSGFSANVGRRRVGYAATTVVLAAIVGVAALGAFGGVGVRSSSVRDQGEGVTLEVTYGAVSRPALATPFDIEVAKPGGFDGPVRIAVDQEYLRMWDENGLAPAPSAETVMGPWLVWEFDPPIGDVLLVTLDARIEPAAQEGRRGTVAVLGDDDAIVAEVEFTTRVWP